MPRYHTILAAILVLLPIAGFAGGRPAPSAPPPTPITVGSKAPPLAAQEFVKGAPVAAFEKGKVYIVEFWATWCGPCITSMPHLSELQAKYRDQGLTVIGVTRLDADGNTLEAVKKLVAAKRDAMNYTVAVDDASTTYDAYMLASSEDGIPCAFIINRDGIVAYIGHPSGLDKPLAQVMAGTHDLLAAVKERTRELKQRIDDAQAIARTEPLQLAFKRAVEAGDRATAMKLLDDIEPIAPVLKSRIAQRRFTLLLTKFNDPTAAYDVASVAIPSLWHDDPVMLNDIAWTIVDPKGAAPRPLDPKALAAAAAAAGRAVELTRSKDPDMLDTLAHVQFEQGDLPHAIQTQIAALALAADDDKPRLQEALDEYRAAKK